MSAKKKLRCEYCKTTIRHYSPSVLKTHKGGKKHKDAVRLYYQTFLDGITRDLMSTNKTMKAGLLAQMGLPGLPGANPALMMMNSAAFSNNIAPGQQLASMPPGMPALPPGFPPLNFPPMMNMPPLNGGMPPMMNMPPMLPPQGLNMGQPMATPPPNFNPNALSFNRQQ